MCAWLRSVSVHGFGPFPVAALLFPLLCNFRFCVSYRCHSYSCPCLLMLPRALLSRLLHLYAWPRPVSSLFSCSRAFCNCRFCVPCRRRCYSCPFRLMLPLLLLAVLIHLCALPRPGSPRGPFISPPSVIVVSVCRPAVIVTCVPSGRCSPCLWCRSCFIRAHCLGPFPLAVLLFPRLPSLSFLFL